MDVSRFVIGLVDGLIRIDGLVEFCIRISLRAHLDCGLLTAQARGSWQPEHAARQQMCNIARQQIILSCRSKHSMLTRAIQCKVHVLCTLSTCSLCFACLLNKCPAAPQPHAATRKSVYSVPCMDLAKCLSAGAHKANTWEDNRNAPNATGTFETQTNPLILTNPTTNPITKPN